MNDLGKESDVCSKRINEYGLYKLSNWLEEVQMNEICQEEVIQGVEGMDLKKEDVFFLQLWNTRSGDYEQIEVENSWFDHDGKPKMSAKQVKELIKEDEREQILSDLYGRKVANLRKDFPEMNHQEVWKIADEYREQCSDLTHFELQKKYEENIENKVTINQQSRDHIQQKQDESENEISLKQ